MVASIPASRIVSVTPSVESAGGTGLSLSGLILSQNTRVPIGTVQSFGSAATVGAFFGLSSAEYSLAQKYFLAYDGSPITPGALLFAQYAAAPVAGYMRGGNVSGLSVAELQALAGEITLSVDGVNHVSSAIDLSGAASPSAAAVLIEAAFAGGEVTVAYDSTSGAFVFTSATTGAASSVTVAAASAIATGLALTAATGAIVSPGSIAMTPASAMQAVIGQTMDFASFMTAWLPDAADMTAFAAWNNAESNRFLYIQWDSNAALTTDNFSETAAGMIAAANYAASMPFYDPIDGANKAAAIMGIFAAIDFTAVNGRVNLSFRSQSGLAAGVSSAPIYDQLVANGINFYGAYATAAQGFVFFYPGTVTGPFVWADTLVNQIWLTNAMQLALMEMLTTITNVPYNDSGNALIEQTLLDPIKAAVSFGAIQPLVVLSNQQIIDINTASGTTDAADTVNLVGWYLQVGTASPQVRAARGSPPIRLWYADGGSVQQIAMNSTEVQ